MRERLGILRIYQTRNAFEAKYPMKKLASDAQAGSTFRMVGKSLFLSLNKRHQLEPAVERGAYLHLCGIDLKKTVSPELITAGLGSGHSEAALSQFNSFVAWLRYTKTAGNIELRYPNIDPFDSHFSFILN